MIRHICYIMLVSLVTMADSSADCLQTHIRTGYVQATITRASAIRPELVSVDLKVQSGLGALIGDPKRKAPEFDLDEVNFFLGQHKSVTLRCEKSLCATLLGLNWERMEVRAWLEVTVDCPDAQRIDLAEVLYFETGNGKSKIRIPYLRFVPKRAE
jgi:hypothetical protein